MSHPLYNPDLLKLAASAEELRRLTVPMASVEKRSATCGSRITVDVRVDRAGLITEIGMAVRACVLGRTSAALLNAAAVGRSAADIAATNGDLAAWLAGDRANPPDWPVMEVLTPAMPHRARHGAIRLAFEAAAEAAEIATGSVSVSDDEEEKEP